MRSEVDIAHGWVVGDLEGCCCWLMEVILNVVFRYENKFRHSVLMLRELAMKLRNF